MKLKKSRTLIALGGHVSVQILNEVTNVSRKKHFLDWQECKHIIQLLTEQCIVHPLTEASHHLARSIAERFKYHIYDSQVIASALEAGCTSLFSEDMQHGQVIDGKLTIINPFI